MFRPARCALSGGGGHPGGLATRRSRPQGGLGFGFRSVSGSHHPSLLLQDPPPRIPRPPGGGGGGPSEEAERDVFANSAASVIAHVPERSRAVAAARGFPLLRQDAVRVKAGSGRIPRSQG